ncbi:hypothetical protein [Bradyrhizobium japonicum]|uniref:hypothetical protein n=1 Tax=Bradyrhizobium japonicum TaxID=375 RepID=UPI00209EE0FD|nr:hypothetical protein [Bradyrhizobium japonicum]MCP1761977.1 hypothetical protein [Bradyrhizobium japonicum]MCP1793557.1 hypothetical protein [Bradyrhizobium japonicum]MCP1805990.1 hypothetical protein [Bradyrhizobium japonicum]MCP1812393.1 hypothetical protein [Bradyrhizobium japonicum]MCP1873564.1 hypothetical protein [Bradyrhizobium japonicum]
MARIRSIKPEFWTSEQVVECSPIARLLFIGIWNFADDAGRIPASPRSLKLQIFPGDDITSETIRGMIDELSANGLLLRYEVDGKEFLQVTGWHHQKIDKPQPPRYPPPPAKTEKHSTTIRRTFATDRIGKEGIGEERKGDAAPHGAPPSSWPGELDFPETPQPPPQPHTSDPEIELFRRGKEVLGSAAGGLVSRLLKAKGGKVPLARAAIEQASTKHDPREYIGAIIRAPPENEPPRVVHP